METWSISLRYRCLAFDIRASLAAGLLRGRDWFGDIKLPSLLYMILVMVFISKG